MTIDQLNDWVDAHIEELQIVRENLVDIFKDTTISVNDRWYLFNKAKDAGIYREIYDGIPHLIGIPDDKISDKFCEQRYKTFDIYVLFDMFELTAKEEYFLKEEILQKGITGFVYDW